MRYAVHRNSVIIIIIIIIILFSLISYSCSGRMIELPPPRQICYSWDRGLGKSSLQELLTSPLPVPSWLSLSRAPSSFRSLSQHSSSHLRKSCLCSPLSRSLPTLQPILLLSRHLLVDWGGKHSPHSCIHAFIPNILSSHHVRPLQALRTQQWRKHCTCTTLYLHRCCTIASERRQAKRQVHHPFIGKSCTDPALCQALCGVSGHRGQNQIHPPHEYMCVHSTHKLSWTKCTRTGNAASGERNWESSREGDFTLDPSRLFEL